jgi:hypothetical protein
LKLESSCDKQALLWNYGTPGRPDISMLGSLASIAYVLKIIIGATFLFVAIALALRSVTTFGVDYLSTLYL